MGNWLRATTQALLFANLLLAPWVFGATPRWAIALLNGTEFLVVASWILQLLAERRWPEVGRWPLGLSVVICAVGIWMTASSGWVYDSEHKIFVALAGGSPHGSIDYALSLTTMLRVVALLLIVLAVIDASGDYAFLMRLWWTIAISGTSISLLGLLQKATGARMIFWQPSQDNLRTFFATYYYHANAGAFLNLTWPFTAGLALRAMQKHWRPGAKAAIFCMLAIDLVAVMANTSRMGQLVAGLQLIALAIFLWRDFAGFAAQFPGRVRIGSALAFAVVIFAIAYASQWEQAIARWEKTSGFASEEGRVQGTATGWLIAQSSGWFGTGPGTFRAAFPSQQGDLPGAWRFLHQDYLQTIIEWGWAGAALWGALVFGGIGSAMSALRRGGRRWRPSMRQMVGCATICLAGVMIHAAVDFPLQIASLQLYVAVALGVCWGAGKLARDRSTV